MSPSRGLPQNLLRLRVSRFPPRLSFHFVRSSNCDTPPFLHPYLGRRTFILPTSTTSPLFPLVLKYPTKWSLPNLLHSPPPSASHSAFISTEPTTLGQHHQQQQQQQRPLNPISPKHHLYLSTSISPFFNLALEHHIFTHATPGHTILFLYVNSPCVVVGRNQNVWREVDVPGILSTISSTTTPSSSAQGVQFNGSFMGVDLVRRRSGGGTVYHDLGNVNYCAMVSAERFKRDRHAEMVVRAVNRLLLPTIPSPDTVQKRLAVNSRHDIVLLDPSTREEKKVSGSAYKISRLKAYHHGTLLLNSHIPTLGRYLKSPAAKYIQGRGVESVRSPVTNVPLPCPPLEVDDVNGRSLAFHDVGDNVSEVCRVIEEIAREWGRMYNLSNDIWRDEKPRSGGEGDLGICYVTEEELLGPDYGLMAADVRDDIVKGVVELRSPEWVWGQTPKFTFTIPLGEAGGENARGEVKVVVDKGFVVDLEVDELVGLNLEYGVAEEARKWFIGKKFDGGIVGEGLRRLLKGWNGSADGDGDEMAEGVGRWCEEMLGRVDVWGGKKENT